MNFALPCSVFPLWRVCMMRRLKRRIEVLFCRAVCEGVSAQRYVTLRYTFVFALLSVFVGREDG